MRMFRCLNIFFFFLSLVCCVFAQQDEPSAAGLFKSFWAEFRTAILNGDMEKVVSLTKFPFEVRGPDDSDPVVYHDQNAFMKIYNDLLNQQIYKMTGSKLTTISMREIIKNKPNAIAGDLLSDDFARVEQFTFIKVKNSWLFNRAYFEE